MNKLKPADQRDEAWANDFQTRMLDWYDKSARDLPWRYRGGMTPNPYFVWLSEIMLQQTTVGAVMSYFSKFIEMWPTVHDLAAAPSEDVMAAWAGLGYYARARNLHKCAKVVSEDLGGIFPASEEKLLKLPGVGPYTAAAISAIAFGKQAVVVDGNIERIMARVFAVEGEVPKVKPYLKTLAAQVFNDVERTGDFAQSLMDLGAGVCIAKTPRCMLCSVNDLCKAYKNGDAGEYPRRAKKKKVPQRKGYVYILKNSKGQILLQRRPDNGLLAGMLGLPTSKWATTREHLAWLDAISVEQRGEVRHVFTHFKLQLEVLKGRYDGQPPCDSYFWIDEGKVDPEDFPTVFKKCID